MTQLHPETLALAPDGPNVNRARMAQRRASDSGPAPPVDVSADGLADARRRRVLAQESWPTILRRRRPVRCSTATRVRRSVEPAAATVDVLARVDAACPTVPFHLGLPAASVTSIRGGLREHAVELDVLLSRPCRSARCRPAPSVPAGRLCAPRPCLDQLISCDGRGRREDDEQHRGQREMPRQRAVRQDARGRLESVTEVRAELRSRRSAGSCSSLFSRALRWPSPRATRTRAAPGVVAELDRDLVVRAR